MKQYEEKYREYLKYELNYSMHTIKMYLLHLNEFIKYTNENNLNYKKLTKEDIRSYLKYLDSKKYSNKTISAILSSLRTFFCFLLDEGVIDYNVFKNIKNPKIEKKIPTFLNYEDMRKILDSLKNESFIEKRDKVIIELLYATGIRVSELVNIKYEDINFNDNSIKIFGKGKKERIVYFNDYAKASILDFKEMNDSEYVIVNYKKNKITTRGIEKIIDKIVLSISLKNKITPHTFRHTFATHMLNNGCNIKSVQELLGHENIDTTEIYTHVTSDYLKEQYLKNMKR